MSLFEILRLLLWVDQVTSGFVPGGRVKKFLKLQPRVDWPISGVAKAKLKTAEGLHCL